ncbi:MULTISPECIES: hypothetical protein [Bacteroidaceae]|jgi:hypothetical protein|uniref:hypothetical protein n=1 Tax=Bacteroidaceae TaxID=815 RepID=UPI0022E323F8|nr:MULTISPECIES: hypothetical protein [Phocaeicola]
MQSFDIPRFVTVYPDQAGIHWWTKAWFNMRKEGEAAVEITRETAFCFMSGEVEKDMMLEKYYPKQMEVYHKAIAQTRDQLLESLGETTHERKQEQINL